MVYRSTPRLIRLSPSANKERVMTFYRRCVQRHMYAHGESKHYLSKSPSFSGKVDALYKNFPGREDHLSDPESVRDGAFSGKHVGF